ncbi:MAG: ATPase, T2SS/T4P/T4SS family [Gemmatimonadota bacterium]|nr:ATPase, T2SS/T4P/T4SS family [Gemmatimonadota bacterium]
MSNIPIPLRPARKPWNDRWLLDAFRERGKEITEEAAGAATAWEALEMSGVKTADLMKVVGDLSAVEPVDVTGVGAERAKLLTQVLSERYDVVAISLEGRVLEVATGNPLRQSLDRDLAFASGKAITLRFAHPAAIRAARDRVYGGIVAAPKSARIEWITPQNASANGVGMTRGAAADALDRIVMDAMDQRASDIHLEPKEGELLVRFRVDGVLHDVTRISADLTPLLLSRLKVSAGLDIANRRKPQDGRASVVLDGRPVDLRISTLPLGERVEKAVVRILDASATTLDFDSLGFAGVEAQQLRRILASNEGMVLVTGPTGSGKTTTLYTALMHLASPETNIVTVEDPIEYRLPGINQVQVEEKQGLTFASALRSILRQDPDVVLVGEIRDAETAEIAIRASMTGHLVLSTLHTNDAVSALTRLADIGLDLGNLASALKGVLAQRLVRRLCPECSALATPKDVPAELRWLLAEKDTRAVRHAIGCPACRGTGYRGRLAVVELLVIDEESRQLMARSSDRQAMLAVAKRAGMASLWEVGLQRVLDGQTSIEELASNVTPPLPTAAMPQNDIDALLKQILPVAGGPVAAAAAPAAASDAPPAQRPTSEATAFGPPGMVRPPLATADASSAPAAAPAPAPAPPPTAPSLPPPEPASEPRSARASVARASMAITIAPRQSGTSDRMRVLVVHEEHHRRRAMRRAFESMGCIVLEAADGETALTFSSVLRPDAVITEVVLPKLNGVGLAQALIAEQIVEHVFVCTDQRDELMLQWVVGVGVTDVIAADDEADVIAARVVRQLPQRSHGLKVV